MSAVCGSCATILDTSKPGLAEIGHVMKTTLQIKPALPIGARGVLKGDTWEVIGFMRRKDKWCSWDEFLLFNPWLGFRYLVTFRGHWSFVRLLPGHHTADRWEGQDFSLFAREEVTTVNVLGEFYWRVRSGEKVQLTDYVRPPFVLSAEFSKELNEVAWSGGEYIDHLEVQLQHNRAELATWLPVEHELVFTKMDRPCAHDAFLMAFCAAVKDEAEAKLREGGVDVAAVKARS